MIRMFAATVMVAGATAAGAQDVITYKSTESYDDVVFALENAIVGAGLVVDNVSHVGSMLERTREDVGATRTLFTQADVYQFCSARVSREMMEADPMNIAFCPYGIFVAELADAPGEVVVGFRRYPDGPMQTVQALLDGIAREAVTE